MCVFRAAAVRLPGPAGQPLGGDAVRLLPRPGGGAGRPTPGETGVRPPGAPLSHPGDGGEGR